MMKQISKFMLIVIVSFSVIFCDSASLSMSEKAFLTNLTESDRFEYSFNQNGLNVKIYNSKIVGTNDIVDFSPVLAVVFFRKVVAQKNTINANGKLKLEYVNKNKIVYTSETPYGDIILVEKLFDNFEEVINNYSSDDVYKLLDGISINDVNKVINPAKINNVNLFKYQVNELNNQNSLFWIIYGENNEVMGHYESVFNENYKLIKIKKIK